LNSLGGDSSSFMFERKRATSEVLRLELRRACVEINEGVAVAAIVPELGVPFL
jgi:hypothetical protein